MPVKRERCGVDSEMLRFLALLCTFLIVTCTYELIEKKESLYGFSGTLRLVKEDIEKYGMSLEYLSLSVYLDKEAYVRVKITDMTGSRYEIPPDMIPRPDVTGQNPDKLYDFRVDTSPFAFRVVRVEDQQIIFSFSSNFTFKNQFIQFSTLIDSNAVTYGLGESTRLNQHLTNGTTYTLWARDEPAAKRNTNLYGSYPVYWQMLHGSAHGKANIVVVCFLPPMTRYCRCHVVQFQRYGH